MAVALPGLAVARSGASHAVRDGFYSTLVGVRSSTVEFHVRSGGAKVPDLALVCTPPVASQAMSTTDIAVHAPVLRLKNGRLSYHGPAKITEAYAGAPKIATTTLTISGYHVSRPVHYYTFEGKHLHQTTAFKGTASSPACTQLPRSGKFTLFGPVPGE
jgi:hypothetical protein